MMLTISDIIQLLSALIALFLGLVSIKISIKAMSQNSKMIEEATRPILIIYSEYIDDFTFNLVVKNIGKSCGTIKKFICDFELLTSGSYAFNGGDYISDFITITLPPNGSCKCPLCYEKINRPVKFDITYESSTKSYKDQVYINLKAGMRIPQQIC